MLNNKTILITGGTGSIGNKLVQRICSECEPQKLIIYSRCEYKQSVMKQQYNEDENKRYSCLRYFLGDVRDEDRLYRAFEGVDIVIHAAALKQVPTLEYNPTEAISTNVDGAVNIVEAAIEKKIKTVVSLSTDKAVAPINLYGATKMCAERIFTAANEYSGHKTKFCSVRYGNVIGSRGSVIPFFLKLKEEGKKVFPVTDRRMTRFWITKDQAVDLIFFAIENTKGGEIFVPKIPSMRITDIARTIEPCCGFVDVGIRAGEKVHETLITEGDDNVVFVSDGKQIPKPDRFTSDGNDSWLTKEILRKILNDEQTNCGDC